jgi:hypothetical protein
VHSFVHIHVLAPHSLPPPSLQISLVGPPPLVSVLPHMLVGLRVMLMCRVGPCVCGMRRCVPSRIILCVLWACVCPQVFEYVERTILEDLEKSPDGLTLEEIRKCIFQLVKSIQVRDSMP